jgi:parallel beta-helix repeat protein
MFEKMRERNMRVHSLPRAAFLSCVVVALAAAPAAAKTISVSATAPSANEKLQEALILAEPGDVVELGAGTWTLTDGLSLDVDNVTVRGAGTGEDGSILDFSGQQGSGEGLLVTSDDVYLTNFAVLNTRGDGIKSKGADRIVYHKLRVEWTAGPKSTNGAYGVYPVESRDVLIDSVYVRGASDAGIYVGQSRNIVVRDSIASENVAGIEIENSFDADVHDNIATKNTGGILVFDLPSLPQQGGHNVRVFGNVINDNSTPNFAPKGNIVASVPTGTGVLVMANSRVELFDNVMGDNGTANVMIVGYRYPYDDAKYQPLPKAIVVRDNDHGKAGFAPAFPGGAEIAATMGGSIPPVLWDGSGDAIVLDQVGVLSLNLPDVKTPQSDAKPSPATLTGTPLAALPAIVLPASMEAKVQ